jgi:hypothetical protein
MMTKISYRRRLHSSRTLRRFRANAMEQWQAEPVRLKAVSRDNA